MLWACGRSYPCAYPLFGSLSMVCPQRLQKQPAFYGLLFVGFLTVVLLVASPGVSAKKRQQPKPQDWQREVRSLTIPGRITDKILTT